jgi:hypothetical protein
MATRKSARASRLVDRPVLAAALSLLAFGSQAVDAVSPGAVAQAEFQRLHPCPANDARAGSCPGYVIEHVVPLCLGGPDVAYNLRWQTVDEAKMNEVRDTRRCPAPRREGESVA